jgi:Amt family ammonium transporter
MGVVTAWALVAGFALFLVLKYTMGVRASREEELAGLDIPEHGIAAYGEEVQPAGAVGS